MDGQQGRLSHLLDRPIWSALTGPQADIAERAGSAVRLRPDYGVFAAAADLSPDSRGALARLPCGREGLWCVETEPVEPPAGMVVHHHAACVQMAAERVESAEPRFPIVDLAEADAAAMFALARLTEPGPFFEHTHRMGRFIGVKEQGRLVAMAGERLRPQGFTEVSGVCTHPDFRGRGYAGGLMRIVAARILTRGETPFLHSYADNESAIALYGKLGFRLRTAVTLTVLMPT